ncbi:TPD1 protein [Rosa sericea]
MSSYHVFFLIYLLIMLIILFCNLGAHSGPSNKFLSSFHGASSNHSATMECSEKGNSSTHRKLLFHGSCANRDISISQSIDTTSGIPRYIVQIVNICVNSGSCAASNIHLHCGWFASARVINPTIFKRLSFDDCLVNGGKPLKTSQSISFTYFNSFMYPLSFKSAKFC